MPEDLSNSYNIRPNFKHKFRPASVKAILHDVLNEELSGKQYSSEEATSWSKHISDTVKEKLKELELDRYKFIVQVVIGEQRGEGVKVACRCLWDSDTDNYAQEIFMNDQSEKIPDSGLSVDGSNKYIRTFFLLPMLLLTFTP